MIIDPKHVPHMEVCRDCLASVSIQSRVTQILNGWNHEVVARNLTALEAGDRPSEPIVDYWRAVRLQVDPMDRFE